MKLFLRLSAFVLLASSGRAQSSADSLPLGLYRGFATVHGQQVPVTFDLSGTPGAPAGAFVNGAERSAASAVSIEGDHLIATFDYYARTLDATLKGKVLSGTFGTASVKYPVTLSAPGAAALLPVRSCVASRSGKPLPVEGEWELQVSSEKGESAWQMKVDPPDAAGLKAVIQRIDGDTGGLYGFCAKGVTYLTHFNATGAALYSLKPRPDGTLLVSNMLRADQTTNRQQDLIARRPAEARKQKLAPPVDPTQQTTMKDPALPFRFSFPDLAGKLVSNTEGRFQGKVVIVAIGGSWCPNCHDEAPFLESLYQQFHDRGLEVVDLSFEEADQLKDPARLRAFIDRYHLTYTVLVAGDPDDLTQKIPQADNLNCWPTSFFLGRDGRVREIHAGFAGPANPEAHAALVQNTTALVEQLLAEPVPSVSAALSK